MKNSLLTGLLLGLLFTSCAKRKRLASLPPSPPTETATALPAPGGNTLTHTVQAGDTYISVARLYDISVAELLTWNKLTYRTPLQTGQRLIVDLNVSQTHAAAVPGKTAEKTLNTHTVQPGETLFRISQQYDVRIEDLRALNNLRSDAIQVGQVLKIKP